MLIDSPRITPADRAHWDRMEQLDAMYATAQRRRLDRLAREAEKRLADFFADGVGYVGVSWGKDSVVVADLAQRSGVDVPLVSVAADPLVMPECDDVEAAFRRLWPDALCETIVQRTEPDPEDPDGWHQTGTLEAGFRVANKRFGERYASGVRAAESAGRTLRMRGHGYATKRTLAPIGWWKTEDVFAYLYSRKLPVHPAYAMTRGGVLDRARMRVAFLTLRCGEWTGSREWEQTYYHDHLRRLHQMAREALSHPPHHDP